MAHLRDIVVAEERHKELMREAARERLLRQALKSRRKRPSFVGRLLVWAGHRLVAWGWRLQAYPGAREAHGGPALDGGG